MTLDATERARFTEITGRVEPPDRPVGEDWEITGRRVAGTPTQAARAVHTAAFGNLQDRLGPGEKATVMLLSTDTQKAGEKFTASLAEPLVSGDWAVAKEGSEVEGLVVVSTKGGRVKGRAELEIAVVALTLSDGQRIAVETEVDVTQAKATKDKDAKTLAITAGIGTAVGAIAGGGKGAATGACLPPTTG